MPKSKTVKTDAVMNMILGGGASNPIIDDEFKERVINSRKADGGVPVNSEGSGKIDITHGLISEFLPIAIKRFNCCGCDRCFAELLTEAANEAPEVVINVRGSDDLKNAELLKKQNRRLVLGVVVRLVIKRCGKGKRVH